MFQNSGVNPRRESTQAEPSKGYLVEGPQNLQALALFQTKHSAKHCKKRRRRISQRSLLEDPLVNVAAQGLVDQAESLGQGE